MSNFFYKVNVSLGYLNSWFTSHKSMKFKINYGQNLQKKKKIEVETKSYLKVQRKRVKLSLDGSGWSEVNRPSISV